MPNFRRSRYFRVSTPSQIDWVQNFIDGLRREEELNERLEHNAIADRHLRRISEVFDRNIRIRERNIPSFGLIGEGYLGNTERFERGRRTHRIAQTIYRNNSIPHSTESLLPFISHSTSETIHTNRYVIRSITYNKQTYNRYCTVCDKVFKTSNKKHYYCKKCNDKRIKNTIKSINKKSEKTKKLKFGISFFKIKRKKNK